MNAGLTTIMRREYVRLRGHMFVLFCVAVLALLAAGSLLPRSYVSEAVLAFDSSALDAMPATAERLRTLASAQPGGALRVETRGRELILGWEGGHPAGLRETLKQLIDELVAQSRASRADALAADAARLEREVRAAREAGAAAEQALAAALAALPKGGDAAAGARLGKLQAEAEVLALETRTGRGRQAELEARVRELATGLEAAEPDDARVLALETQLREACRRCQYPARATTAPPDRGGARGVGAAGGRERADPEAGPGRQRGGCRLARRRVGAGAAGRGRRAGARAAGAPLHAQRRPGQSAPGQRLAGRQQLLAAVAAGAALAFLACSRAASARSAKSLVLLADELQVKPLVELPVWRDPMTDPAARWRRAGLVLLGLLTAAAGAAFLRVV
ncbi:MAG: hypothetical protein IPF57_16210 [Gammaproteobacteria bacterium]|nr:hypothetical protein [Gammaproteobacteria bacterium]